MWEMGLPSVAGQCVDNRTHGTDINDHYVVTVDQWIDALLNLDRATSFSPELLRLGSEITKQFFQYNISLCINNKYHLTEL